MKKRKRRPQPWWQDMKVWRRTGIAVAAALLLVIGGWAVITSGKRNESPPVYLTDPAPDFTLPTIDGGQVTLKDHLGKHNMLLYFNEGMG